ncbi:hypothetical protein DV515_00015409 [Chloebia gouldiae]|uniref:mitogen-activated protein kinase n=1 Tax=Chloebia gouldiae TaxID=44316 RepID=A0A3L8RVM5_CHLGU|nr:hypothetical protein DV515_00015409 [Chloebia gouldiae]
MSPPEVEPLLCRKYEIKRRLGKGAYGIVWRATDRQTGETVAVKKIFDAFRNRTDAQRTFREIMFLQYYEVFTVSMAAQKWEIKAVKAGDELNDPMRIVSLQRREDGFHLQCGTCVQEFGEHPNIIKLLDVIQAENDKDIYLIFESMETDLHAPSNVLLDAQCRVKLCDFGLARSLCQRGEPQPSPVLTEYMATRWYRAPEILLASRRYTKGVDMWSIGCILGEMLLGKPLFPGTSTMNQIEQILRVIPAPSPEDTESLYNFFLTSRQRVAFEEIFPSSTPLPALDLLKKLLVFNPDKRLTAEQALQHPYVSRFHCPSREPSLDFDVILPLGDDVQLSVTEYRNKLYEMILEKKSKSFPKEQGQGENTQLSQSESSTLLPGFSSVAAPTRKGQEDPTPHLLNPSHVHPGVTAGVQAAGSSQSKDQARAVCQRSQMGVMVYNPITHTTVQSGYHPPTLGEMQILVLGSGTVLHHLNSPESPTNPRNTQCHSKDVHPFLKPSKKMFPITANVGAAGDPRASMGSYSQAYGTISKSALQSLPIAKAPKSPEQ